MILEANILLDDHNMVMRELHSKIEDPAYTLVYACKFLPNFIIKVFKLCDFTFIFFIYTSRDVICIVSFAQKQSC